LALAYVDSRWYLDRLDAVAGPDWSDDYEVQPGGTVVLCKLTIYGVTRTDIGEAESADQNTATSALAQAFKRACARFGLGRYLYRLPKTWVAYDAQRKRFTDEALARLQHVISHGNGRQPQGVDWHALQLAVTVPAGEYAGKSLGWLLENDRDYLQRIADEANDAGLAKAARGLLNNN
ncbi:Rad52/Rad22 family DNA repair protein, partial [Chloroflexota bacterium]